jgi:hypothetical protein
MKFDWIELLIILGIVFIIIFILDSIHTHNLLQSWWSYHINKGDVWSCEPGEACRWIATRPIEVLR